MSKIAISADIHLDSGNQHIERENALRKILQKATAAGCRHVILAGDIFHRNIHNPAFFEALISDLELQLHLIPGNHDSALRQGLFSSNNIHVHAIPELVELEHDIPPVLFIPYQSKIGMGEIISGFSEKLHVNAWLLVGHGDFSPSMRHSNTAEAGVYMPLTLRDIEMYQPRHVFLGHIHKPASFGRVHYPGSACGLDITETGRRSFLIYDSQLDKIERMPIQTDIIYFDEIFYMYPREDECAVLLQQIKQRIAAWQLTAQEKDRVRIRVQLHGYCTDRTIAAETVHTALDGFVFYENDSPDLSRLSTPATASHKTITAELLAALESMPWPEDVDEPAASDFIEAALHILYGAAS